MNFCFSSYLILEEKGFDNFHPEDVKCVKDSLYHKGWQLLCFQYLGKDKDFSILSDGSFRFRVKNAFIGFINEPKYFNGDNVFVKRKNSNGKVDVTCWHQKKKEPYYLVSINGKRSKYQYFKEDINEII